VAEARLALFGLIASATVVACGGTRDAPPAPSSAANVLLREGPWRAVLTLPGGELPFCLEFARSGERWIATLVNGSERTRIDEVELRDGALTLRMPGYENLVSARLEDGMLRGELLMVKLGGKAQRIPFEARFGLSHRFVSDPPTPAPYPDYSGRWAIEFGEGEVRSRGVGEFRQQGRLVTGTFLTPTGDHRFLAGEVVDGELRLSKFDGGHAFLYRARLGSDGRLTGQWWSGLAFTETFTGQRDAEASLGDAAGVTRLRDGSSILDIRFPDLNGELRSLRDPRFTGKVVVLALAGSWCPNCHDEAAFLASFYRQHRERGLEIVSLMFEQFGDFARAAAATHRFRQRYGIEYPTLIAGTSDKDDAASKLPQLNGVFAFPTTIFIDRAGKVRRIHTGFSGPATGVHHERLIEEFTTLVEQLLAETSDPEGVRLEGT
jgi:thiol-disulfide isomerase/thioredoxin